jgi:hypothetical protein
MFPCMTSFVVFLQIGFCCCPALLLIGYLLLVLDPTLVRFSSIVSSFMPPVLVQIFNAVLFLDNLFCWWGSMMECML